MIERIKRILQNRKKKKYVKLNCKNFKKRIFNPGDTCAFLEEVEDYD